MQQKNKSLPGANVHSKSNLQCYKLSPGHNEFYKLSPGHNELKALVKDDYFTARLLLSNGVAEN